VFSASFERVDEAVFFERQIKGWSRAKKQALIRGDYAALPRLAEGNHAPHPEERAKGARLEGWQREVRLPILRDGASRLLRMRGVAGLRGFCVSSTSARDAHALCTDT
jgi:hypothetical protein